MPIAIAAVAALLSGLAVQESPSRAEILEAARTVMAWARYATLVTLDQAGQPRARIVDPFEPEADFRSGSPRTRRAERWSSFRRTRGPRCCISTRPDRAT